MVRENMRSPRAELHFTLVSQETSGVSFLGSTPGLRRGNRPQPPVWVVRGGLAQMVERSLRMRQARGSMPLSSTRATLVAHEHEPPVPGLVSSVGRAHDSYDLRRSHERRRLLRSCGRGFNPRIGCKEVQFMVVCGHTTLHEQSAEKECPADPGSSPGEGDKQVHCYFRCPS